MSEQSETRKSPPRLIFSCTNPVVEAFEKKLRSSWPVQSWLPVTTIVATSGGPDSTTLLLALARIRHAETLNVCDKCQVSGQLLMAHVNHQLRGVESDHDAEFVSQLARKLELPLFVATLEPPNSSSGIEAHCRQLRYQFLSELAQKEGARFVVTAHHQGDQIETLLFRAFRGTSVAGLASIPAFREWVPNVTLARPMLNFTQAEVSEYLRSIDQQSRTDSTNLESNFKRNWIRNELLPAIRARFGNAVDDALCRLASSAGEQSQLLNQLVDDWLDDSAEFFADGSVRLDLNAWSSKDAAMIRFALVRIWQRQAWPQQSMTSVHYVRLADMILQSQPCRHALPDNIEAEILDHDRMKLGPTGSQDDLIIKANDVSN